MTETTLSCIKIESTPHSLILPSECVAHIVHEPEVLSDAGQQAKWMAGYALWNGQEIPLLCFENLVSESFDRPDLKPKVIILNPIPKAPRKTYGALLCFGEIGEITLPSSIKDAPLPAEIDRRYCESAFEHDGNVYIIPRLTALGVAFSYY